MQLCNYAKRRRPIRLQNPHSYLTAIDARRQFLQPADDFLLARRKHLRVYVSFLPLHLSFSRQHLAAEFSSFAAFFHFLAAVPHPL